MVKDYIKGFSYLVIIALDPFSKSNGATKYIPNSFKNLDKPKEIFLVDIRSLQKKLS